MKRLLATLLLLVLPLLGCTQDAVEEQSGVTASSDNCPTAVTNGQLTDSQTAILVETATRLGYMAGLDVAGSNAQSAMILSALKEHNNDLAEQLKKQTLETNLTQLALEAATRESELQNEVLLKYEERIEELEAKLAERQNPVESTPPPAHTEGTVLLSEIEPIVSNVLVTAIKQAGVKELPLRIDRHEDGTEDRCVIVQPDVWAKHRVWPNKACTDILLDQKACIAQIGRQHQLPTGWETDKYALSSDALCFPVATASDEFLKTELASFVEEEAPETLQHVVHAFAKKVKAPPVVTQLDANSAEPVTLVVPLHGTPQQDEQQLTREAQLCEVALEICKDSQKPGHSVEVTLNAEAYNLLGQFAKAANSNEADVLRELVGSCKKVEGSEEVACTVMHGTNGATVSVDAASSISNAKQYIKQQQTSM